MKKLNKSVLWVILIVMAVSFASWLSHNKPDEFESGTIGVGVVVTDLERSLDFYINGLGMTKTGEFPVNAEFGKRSGLTDGVPFDVTVLKLKEEQNATEWKLMSFGKEAGHQQPQYIHDDTGMQYVTIFVTSIIPFLERFEKYGIKLLGETPTKLDDGRTFVLIQDPDGTFIELIGSE